LPGEEESPVLVAQQRYVFTSVLDIGYRMAIERGG
jgi:hypothetical protein